MPEEEVEAMNTFIYALCEPGTRTVRYIGKANDPKARVRQHIHEARGITGGKTHRDRWILSVLSKNRRPGLIILSSVLCSDWKQEEQRFIASARMLGMNLVNATDGGDGVDGYRHTAETRALLSRKGKGRKASDETRKRMSDARRGVPLSEANRRALIGFKRPGASSRYPGVSWQVRESKWRARWPHSSTHAEYFESELEAHKSVEKKRKINANGN